MDNWTLLGLLAGFLTTMGFVPQIVKGFKTKKMEDVSSGMLLLLGIGMFLWMVYGILIDSLPVIFWNAIALSLNVVLIVLKMKYHHT
ncbi:MAG: SemiSWEET transporter [Methanomassiliicoccales archaeon]|jgi:MtN3 and saliva related transmembrane protein|nr:SemiSWEET transporter [Methanomassiliicoccales archaeon]